MDGDAKKLTYGRPAVGSEWTIGGRLVHVHSVSDTHVIYRPVDGADPEAAPFDLPLQTFLDAALSPQAELAL